MAKKKVSTSGGAANKKLPLNQSIPLGIQHVFAMFAGKSLVGVISKMPVLQELWWSGRHRQMRLVK